MATGVIGEASAAMRGMNTPWQGPRTAASLAAAVGGGFVLLNAGRSLVDAVNAAGQGDYGSALTNAAIGVGWYAAGRFALGTLARELPLEKGALAAYEEAAEAKFAREDPARYQQITSKFKKEQNMAQAAADSAAVASTNTVDPDKAQAAANGAAQTAAEMTSKPKTRRRRANNAGAGTVTAQSTTQAAAAQVVAAQAAAPQTVAPQTAAAQAAAQMSAELASAPAANKTNVQPPPVETSVRPPFVVTSAQPPPIVTSGPSPSVATSRGRGRARGGVRGMARRFSILARRTARRAARRWEAIERWATSFAAASTFRGLRF